VHWWAFDLDGNQISIEADELEGRVFQHEIDHLNGVLLVERLDEDQRRDALKILRARTSRRARRGPRRPSPASFRAEVAPPAS